VFHAVTIFTFDVFQGLIAINDTGLHQYGNDSISLESNLVDGNLCSLEGLQDRVQSKHITTNLVILEGMMNIFTNIGFIL